MDGHRHHVLHLVRRGGRDGAAGALAILALTLTLALAGCGSAETEVVAGAVIDVAGGLQDLESFTIVDETGRRFVFRPDAEATFHGGPLGHLRDHLRSGEPVVVRYRESGDMLIAVEVSD